MSYIDQQLPKPLTVGAELADTEPGLNIVTTDGGFIVANNRHAQSTLEWSIAFQPKKFSAADHAAVIDLFKASRGGQHYFPFRSCDPAHSELAAEQIGVGDGATVAFQITKTWIVDSTSQVRKVTRPVDPIQVFVDGVEQLSGVTVDYTTGVVTFSVAPAGGEVVTVTGKFLVPVRFTAEMVMTGLANFLAEFGRIDLVEVKE